MVGPKPKPIRPLATKGALEITSDLKKAKKTVTKKPVNDTKDSKTPVPPVAIKESVVVKLQPTQIDDAVQAFTKLLDLNSAEAEEKSLFSSEGQKISLQISGVKLPRDCESQVIKIKLPHSTLPETREVCLFVKDLEKGLKVDHEDSVRHFTSLLADKGVKGVTQIISLRELKVEYKQYEAKTQLCHRFDQFLADARVIRLLPQFLGKAFYKRKKLPMQINLQAKDLPAEFGRCLNTTQLPIKNTGSCSTVVVGLTHHTPTQLLENTRAVVDKLVEKYPGGWVNIRSLHLNSGSTSLPLYVSFRSTAEVGLVKGSKKKNRSVVVDELSTVVGGTVVVTPSGMVKVKRKADPMWTEDDDTLKELLKDERGSYKAAEEAEEKEKEENKVIKAVTPEKEKKPKQEKAKKQKRSTEEDESEDDMEDQEMEYMKKVAEEEEQMEKQLEENEDKLEEKLNADKNDGTKDDDNDDDEVDDDTEAEDLLSEGDDSDSEEELIMKNVVNDEDEEVEQTPKKKKKSKTNSDVKKSSKSLKEKSTTKKDQKKQKFVEKKKKEKTKGKK